jgi:hypothetical protein
MVEYTVKKILKSVLGDFIDSNFDLKMSLLSGTAELKMVKIKKDIFQKFGLPLQLIHG